MAQKLSNEAIKSVQNYLKFEFRDKLITSMTESAFAIDACDDNDKPRVFYSSLAEYRLLIAELIPDAVSKFLEIILACPDILNSDAPHEFLKLHIIQELIEPATRMTHAWLYWILKGHPVGYKSIPMGIDKFDKCPLILPDWWFFGAEDPNRQLTNLPKGLSDSEKGRRDFS